MSTRSQDITPPRACPRAELPPLPARLSKRPVDARGYPIPWFVQYVNGQPDFRIMDEARRAKAIQHKLCWICGEPLGRWMTFVLGPMCVIHQHSGEPPAHSDCATFAAQACPWMRYPNAKRRAAGLPEDAHDDGVMVARNAGAAACWTTHGYARTRHAYLLRMYEPASVVWYAHGRLATREEAAAALALGLKSLEETGSEGAQLAALYTRALKTLPHTQDTTI
jgi:hypothetical protein